MDDETPVDLVEVGVYATSAQGFEHGLVVLAIGYPFWLEPAGDQYRLMVESPAAEIVAQQLARFDGESLNWPPREFSEPASSRKFEMLTPLIWGVAILVSFWAQREWPRWTSIGVLDALAVFERGEWWRVLTALLLHADVGHLVSNLVSGIFVFSAVLTTLGRRRGWTMLILASVVGNLLAAALKYPGVYRSLGASTAIFAAVGLLTGRALRGVLRGDRAGRWRALFVPLAAGLSVLGLYGAGGQEVDVLAHLTGFAAGLGLGFVAGGQKVPRVSNSTS
jgi:rhomboid protease GluP